MILFLISSLASLNFSSNNFLFISNNISAFLKTDFKANSLAGGYEYKVLSVSNIIAFGCLSNFC